MGSRAQISVSSALFQRPSSQSPNTHSAMKAGRKPAATVHCGLE